MMTAQIQRQWQVARVGTITPFEDVQVGFETAPAALMRLFEGGNLGKQILKVA